MKQVFFFLAFCFGLVFVSCSNEDVIPLGNDYEKNKSVLIKYVDVDESTYMYYLNMSLRDSTLDFLTEYDKTALDNMPVEYIDSLQLELDELNGLMQAKIASGYDGYIYFCTYHKVVVYKGQENPSISVEMIKNGSDNETRVSAYFPPLNIYYDMETYSQFNAKKRIYSQLQQKYMINNVYFYFDVVCETDAYMTPTVGGSSNRITISGYSVTEWRNTWTANSSDEIIKWSFKAKAYNPKVSAMIANVTFGRID